MASTTVLRNHAEIMLRAVVADIGTAQSDTEQRLKSEGQDVDATTVMNRAALGHALARVNDGFDIERLVAEFRALRASVNRIWWNSIPAPHKEQIEDMGRFYEALDQLVAVSIAGFTERVNRSRELFLGILGHDLRQPLCSMKMFIELMAEEETPPADAKAMLGIMRSCCGSMQDMLDDLLDFTSSQLGSAMPVVPVPGDLAVMVVDVVEEVRATAPKQQISLRTSGDTRGEWDPSRIRQMTSNLLVNALHHGTAGEPITVVIEANEESVTLTVKNAGGSIPPDSIATLFDPMVRIESDKTRMHGSIGLGLYICKQIAISHKGEIHVESEPGVGTAFIVTLPRIGQ